MKYLIIVCCLFISAKGYSQSSEISIKVLQDFFRDKLPLTYSNTIHQYDLKYLKEILVTDTLYNHLFFGQKNNGKQLILTKDEKNYVLEKIDEQQSFIWPSNLFRNSQNNDSVEINLTSKFEKSFQTIYHFSRPVFIRNNSICIFYYGYYCGRECGQGSIEICKKIKDKWTRWISIIQWIS